MPSQAHSRRDPQQGKKGFSKNKGFTVIELLIAIAVIAIIASLALPSYRAIIEKRQVTSAAEKVSAILGAVKSEAVKLNTPVAFSYDQDSQCLGIHQILSDDETSCTFTPNADERTCAIDCGNQDTGSPDYQPIDRAWYFEQFSDEGVVGNINLIDDSGEGFLVFDHVRGIIDSDFSSGVTIPLVSDTGMYALNVQVDRMGRIYICNPAGDFTPVPGYTSCP